MGEFVRSRSKVWWGNFHADDEDDDEDDDDEDWRLGVASCCSANNSCSDSDRGSSGSPESHKSQDSGFSDSESSSPSTGLSLTRIPRPSLLSKSNREKNIGSDNRFDSPILLCQGEEETDDPEEGSSEESQIMGKNKDRKVKETKSLKSTNSSGLPLRDIKNTLEICTTNKRNFGSQIVKTNVENERYHDLKPEEYQYQNKIIDNFSFDQNDENDDNFSSYQEKNENKKKYNFVVNELKTTLQESNCKKNRKPSLKDGDNFSYSITIGDYDQSIDLNQTKITDDRLNNRPTDDYSRTEFREHEDSSKTNHTCDDLKESLINSNVTSDDNKNFKVPEVITNKNYTKNGTKPKFKLNSAKSITKYFQPNRSLERTKLRKSQISESSVRKLFLQNDPNRSLEQTRVLRSQLKIGGDDPTEELNLSSQENDQKQESCSSDSSYFHTEETARFIGDFNTNGIDSSTWSIPGPPAHCSTPKSSSEPERIPQESVKKMTPHKLCFDEKEVLPKEQSITSYQQPNFDVEVQIENKPLNHWLNEVRYLYEPECMTTLQSKSLTADLNSQVTIMAAVTTEAVRSLQFRTKLISTEFSKLYRKVESGVLDHVGPLVQSLVGHVTEFLETCNLSVNDQQLLIKACDRLRAVADGSKLNQHVLATETTNLGRTFTYCVDTLLLEQVKVLMAVLDEPSSPILLLTALSSLTGLGLEGQHLSQLIARCPGGIRSILTICIDSRNTSVRSAALRTLATVCCSSHTIRQLEQAGGVEVLSEILLDDSRSEMELSEAISVIVQITAPWVEDNHSVLGLSQQLVPLVSSFTRIVSNTTSSSTLLLSAAALCHLSQLEPQCIWTMLENSTAGTLLLAIRRQGPFSPVFLREQAAGLLANMAAVPEARAHLAEHRAVVALLCFLQVRHSPLQSSAEVAAAERLQHKSAIALSRLCSDPAVAAQVVELQGVTRLVRLCKEDRERNHSDGVLVACLAALRKIVANCGTKSVEELNALELVEPRLLDSFLIYSSRQESYV